MKLITRDIDYAIRALCCIAKNKKDLISTRELINCLNMPKPFLRKILQVLNKKGLVRSYKGKNGGFSLAKHPDKISLEELINIFQGPITLSDHTFKKKPCPHSRACKIKKRIGRIERLLITELKYITISSLINRKSRRHD
ncbi:MAG: Rrf2 family transcriptional regulator [Candidatus Omnitrophota bacterium]